MTVSGAGRFTSGPNSGNGALVFHGRASLPSSFCIVASIEIGYSVILE